MVDKSVTLLYLDAQQLRAEDFLQNFSEHFKLKTVNSYELARQSLASEEIGVLICESTIFKQEGGEPVTFLKELKANYPGLIVIALISYDELAAFVKLVDQEVLHRYLVQPAKVSEVLQLLSWAVEMYQAGQQNSALQGRLLQAEKLITLGALEATLHQDLLEPFGYLKEHIHRLYELTHLNLDLKKFVAKYRSVIAPADLTKFANLLIELPYIADNLQMGAKLVQHSLDSVTQILTPAVANLHPEVEPVSVIKYVLRLGQKLAVAVGAMLLYDGPSKLPLVALDFAELADILLELLHNAALSLQSVGKVGGRITLLAYVKPEEPAAGLPERICIVVQDDGPGMSPEVLERASEPFFSTRPDRVGLGIAKVRKIVLGRGGSFTLESTPGVGTRVTLSLPKVKVL